jgi:hypothetical protein
VLLILVKTVYSPPLADVLDPTVACYTWRVVQNALNIHIISNNVEMLLMVGLGDLIKLTEI